MKNSLIVDFKYKLFEGENSSLSVQIFLWKIRHIDRLDI